MKLLSAVDITRNIVEAICPVIIIDSWTYDKKKKLFTINTCDTFYLIPCKTIVINGIKFEVQNDGFIQDESFVIKEVTKYSNSKTITEIKVDSFDLYKPFFFHGSPVAVNNVLSNIKFGDDKTPTVYLWETLREKHFEKSSGSPIAFEYDVKIFFLDSAKWDTWDPDQHKERVIDPMKSLLNEFKKVVNKNRKLFAQLEDFVTIPRANFGVYQKDLGVMSSYFSDMTSGVELNMNFRYKKWTCKDKCK